MTTIPEAPRDAEPGVSPEDALHSPHVPRNRGPILAVLRRILPVSGTVLEIASGTGEHAVHCAAALPALAGFPPIRIRKPGAASRPTGRRRACRTSSLPSPSTHRPPTGP
jgi:hypothetical protein